MFMKKVLVSALFAAGMIGAVATPLPSVAAVDIQLNFGPPAARYEVVPASRRGYVWAPGHWQWNANRNRHIWTVGYWERARRLCLSKASMGRARRTLELPGPALGQRRRRYPQ